MSQSRESNLNPIEIQNDELKTFLAFFCKKTDFDLDLFLNVLNDTDESTVIKILAHYKENLNDCIDKVQTACKKNDSELAVRAIHKVAGSSELLGFKYYADQSRDLIKKINQKPQFEVYISELETYLNYMQELEHNIEVHFPTLNLFL